MQTLDRSLRGVREHIPIPWENVSELIQPGPGHLVVLLGAPGVGKSAFALAWALSLREPVLVISQDTDLTEQAARTVAYFANVPKSEIEDDLDKWENYLKANIPHLPMMIDYPLQAESIGEVLEAAEEFYGSVPRLVLVDVLKDVIVEDGYEGHRQALRDLHWIARKYHCCVVVLHHVNRQGGNADGTRRLRLTDGQYAGEHDAEIVLGLWTPTGFEDPLYGWQAWHPGSVLRVSVLKNRFGAKDPDGARVYADLSMDLERMRIG